MSAAEMEAPNICPICGEQKPAADDDGHCSYECASGGGWSLATATVLPSHTLQTARGPIEVTPLPDGRKRLKGFATYDYRESIKTAAAAAGQAAEWVPGEKCWLVPVTTDLNAAFPPPPPPPPKRTREQWSREEYQNWLIRHIHRKVFGPCCRHAVAYESRPYGPICYRCHLHGSTINDYTGD